MKTFCVSAIAICIISLISLGVKETSSISEVIYPQVNDSDGRTPLYFSLIQSFSSGPYISAYSMPGLQLALDLINNDSSLLPGYSLHYVFTDTPVSIYRQL